MRRSRQPPHAEALVSRCTSCPASFSQYRGISRGTPCCFRHVTVESTERAAAPLKKLVTGAAMCVAFSPHIRPRLYSPTGGQFSPVCTVRSAHIFALSFLQPALTKRISASRYLSCYLSQGWTCSLIAPEFLDTLDAYLKFGTLAERTSKQPGSPGTQQDKD